LRRAIWVSGGITAYLLMVRFVAAPLHVRGWAQATLAACNALGYVLIFPGSTVAGLINQRAIEHIDGIHWWLALASNFILYASGLCVVSKFRRKNAVVGSALADGISAAPEACPSGTVPSAKADPTNPSRRQFFRKSADLAVGGVLGGAFGYSLLLEPAQLRVTRRTFAIRDLPPSLQGLRLVQVSDIHHGPWLSVDRVREVVRRTNALQPDLILLTGDYVYESPRYIEPAIAELSELKAKIGIVGVLGNHDWWDRGVPMKNAFARNGLPLIDNMRLILTPGRSLVREANEGLCLAGVGDLWEDVPDYQAALSHLPSKMPRLLLAHNPDAAEDPKFLAGKHRVDLMISGHTHGGQVWIPGIGTPIVPSRFGQKYAAGLVQGPGCPVFISRGIGMSGLPIRFCVPPEIVVMELKRA
jgi:predicted MPP superfamily phosphohydrolase